jgi:hypothetical protein
MSFHGEGARSLSAFLRGYFIEVQPAVNFNRRRVSNHTVSKVMPDKTVGADHRVSSAVTLNQLKNAIGARNDLFRKSSVLS